MTEHKLELDAWKIFRILAEFVEGFETMTNLGPSVTIFGSARVAPTHPYYQIGKELANKIAKQGLGIITGGGPGLMAAANEGAREAKGRSCGVSIDLPLEEQHNPFVDRKYQLCLRYFFVRKVMFLRYAQAFIFLPGGVGTLDELFETLTLIQTRRTKPFPVFLFGTAYWQGLIDWLKAGPLQEKFINTSDLELFTLTDDVDFVVKTIVDWHGTQSTAPTFKLDPR